MKKENIFLIVIFLITLLSFYLFSKIISPFLISILWGILLAIVFYPLFERLLGSLRRKRGVSSAIMTALVALIIILPFSFLTFYLAREVIDTYHRIEQMMLRGELQIYL